MNDKKSKVSIYWFKIENAIIKYIYLILLPLFSMPVFAQIQAWGDYPKAPFTANYGLHELADLEDALVQAWIKRQNQLTRNVIRKIQVPTTWSAADSTIDGELQLRTQVQVLGDQIVYLDRLTNSLPRIVLQNLKTGAERQLWQSQERGHELSFTVDANASWLAVVARSRGAKLNATRIQLIRVSDAFVFKADLRSSARDSSEVVWIRSNHANKDKLSQVATHFIYPDLNRDLIAQTVDSDYQQGESLGVGKSAAKTSIYGSVLLSTNNGILLQLDRSSKQTFNQLKASPWLLGQNQRTPTLKWQTIKLNEAIQIGVSENVFAYLARTSTEKQSKLYVYPIQNLALGSVTTWNNPPESNPDRVFVAQDRVMVLSTRNVSKAENSEAWQRTLKQTQWEKVPLPKSLRWEFIPADTPTVGGISASGESQFYWQDAQQHWIPIRLAQLQRHRPLAPIYQQTINLEPRNFPANRYTAILFSPGKISALNGDDSNPSARASDEVKPCLVTFRSIWQASESSKFQPPWRAWTEYGARVMVLNKLQQSLSVSKKAVIDDFSYLQAAIQTLYQTGLCAARSTFLDARADANLELKSLLQPIPPNFAGIAANFSYQVAAVTTSKKPESALSKLPTLATSPAQERVYPALLLSIPSGSSRLQTLQAYRYLHELQQTSSVRKKPVLVFDDKFSATGLSNLSDVQVWAFFLWQAGVDGFAPQFP